MKLQDKIIMLRKSRALSQEELAAKLGVSRQAVSRWETGESLPDAMNILQLTKAFGVTADYLLNDDLDDETSWPSRRESISGRVRLAFILLVAVEAIALLLQFASMFATQNALQSIFSLIPLVTALAGFEYIFWKYGSKKDEGDSRLRRRFYKVSAWLGLYCPVRLTMTALMHLWPRPYSTLAAEAVILVVYLVAVALVTLLVETTLRAED